MLRRAFGLGSSQALIRMLCSFVSVKLTAVYLGPAGFALIAQVNTLITLGQGLLGAGINTATVRLTAEYGESQALRRKALWATGFKMAAGLGIVGALALLAAAPILGNRLLGREDYAWAIALCGVGIIAAMINNVLLGALNGVRDIRRVVQSNVIATLVGLLAFAPSCMLWGTTGGICGSIAGYVAGLFISVLLSRRSTVVQLKDFVGQWDTAEAKRILAFYPMLIAHAALPPLAMLMVRDSVIGIVGLEAGGVWQAAWRLSEVYTGIITTSVSLYFMPRLGELANDGRGMRREVWRTLAAATGVTAALAMVIYLLRDWVVRLVFSASFDGVQNLMPVQLLGDVLKMAAWILGFVLVATVRTRWYLAIEILVPLFLVGAVRTLTPLLGSIGAMWAFVLASTFQLVLGAIALRDLLFAGATSPGSQRS